MRRGIAGVIALGVLATTPLVALALGAPESDAVTVDTVTIVATGVSKMEAASAGDVTREQLQGQPLLRPGAVLENVPGLIVTQHSGEGKANQYFLRAFNLDHGTDLATEVDDMPINMPSHAHGQGYTDLNFLIPELVGDLHFKKGPYYPDEGDFATAGAVRMELLDETPTSATLGYGMDGYRRALLMGSVGNVLGAFDIYHNDGPFDRPDDYHRLNGALRYHLGNDRDFYTLTAMAYSGKWNATDQIPARAIDLIGRFGTLNPTDGGRSDRYSLSFNRVLRTDTDQLQFSAYAIRYKLDLWSTFTYYLEDPVLGDQMLQHDDRVVYGFKGSQTWYTARGSTVIGVQGRFDDIRDVGIDATFHRQYLATKQDASVKEASGAFYLENSTQWRSDLRTVVGLREDEFGFDVHDRMAADPLGSNTGSPRAGIFSPKLGIILGPWARTSYFINVGEGYHSNDARGVTRGVTPLTRAKGAEMGLASEPVSGWQTTLNAFLLKLRSELVFDGDAGVTTPSGATTRVGVEWGNVFHFDNWLQADLNAAISRARFDHNAPDDELAITGRYIPNSPTAVVDAGITAQHPAGWFASLRARHFGESPLVEDNSARSPAYTTFDLRLGYQRPGRWSVAVDTFNLFDVKWNDIEYYYVSRLQGEAAPHPDYVVHPGVPRTIRGHFQIFLQGGQQ